MNEKRATGGGGRDKTDQAQEAGGAKIAGQSGRNGRVRTPTKSQEKPGGEGRAGGKKVGGGKLWHDGGDRPKDRRAGGEGPRPPRTEFWPNCDPKRPTKFDPHGDDEGRARKARSAVCRILRASEHTPPHGGTPRREQRKPSPAGGHQETGWKKPKPRRNFSGSAYGSDGHPRERLVPCSLHHAGMEYPRPDEGLAGPSDGGPPAGGREGAAGAGGARNPGPGCAPKRAARATRKGE